MRKHLLIIILFLAAAAGPDLLFSQEEIVKSDIIEHLDGKDYYIHSVEQGQTLYAISKVYDIAVDELLFENPDARQGLNIGQQLRIPLVSREKLITDDLRKGEFRYIFHIVRKGQTLYGISRIYDVSVDDLKAANPEWAKGLDPGQYLKIPMKDPVVNDRSVVVKPDAESRKMHTVAGGETLYSISRKYRVGLPELKAANPGLTSNLSPGQEIVIPEYQEENIKQEEEKTFYEHTVKEKETLYGIARKYRISMDSLTAFNQGLSKNIFPGEVIRIPQRVNPDSYITHRVNEKTKLKKIASKYAISVTAIKDANPDFRSRVNPGDMLMIPVGPPPLVSPDDVHVVITPPDDIPPKVMDSDSIRCYDKMYRHKKDFNVALMIPLYAEEAREISLKARSGALDPRKHKSFNFIQFYEGFLMAVDELEKQGLNVRLYLYDVDEKVSKTIQVLQQPELADMDLIIGPFFSRNFTLVSNFAEMFDIKIVNPLTRRTEVLSNPNVFKIKPSRDAQAALLTKFVEIYQPDANIILVRNNKFQYEDEVLEIRGLLDKVVPYGVKVPNASIYDLIVEYSKADTNLAAGVLINSLMVENRMIQTAELENSPADSTFFSNGIAEVIYATDSVYGVIRNASVVRNNLVIVLTNNEIFAPEILTRLNDLKDTFDITVVGMPEWDLLDNLETDYLLDLKVYYFTDAYYDYDDPDVKSFIMDFRERYKTHPDDYAFEGYDLGTFFLGALMRFGTDCEKCLPYYREKVLSTTIKFSPAYPAGYENLYWNLCRYRNYRIEKVIIQ